jgi:hypothetical protein
VSLLSLGTWLRWIFEPMLDCWQVLKYSRFSVLTVVAVGVFLIGVPQGREVLLLLHSPPHDQPWYVSAFVNAGFVGAVLVWALMVWYWPRVILAFQFEEWPPTKPSSERKTRILWFHRWIPRFLGALAFAAAALAIGLSASQYTHPMERVMSLAILTGTTLLVGTGFVIFVIKRRQWFQLPKFEEEPLYHSRQQLPLVTRRVLYGSIVWLVALFLVFQYRDWNLWLAPKLSAPTILVLAAASWVSVGTVLVYWGSWYRVPVFTLLLTVVVLFSLWNDNHPVRWLDPSVPGAASAPVRRSLSEQFEHWLQQRMREREQSQSAAPIPVIIVTADGGGSRAAYWTASVLAKIQEDREDFAQHVFAISGVSGGSLGAGVFTALVAGRADPDSRCQDTLLDCARAILKRDLLAPTFATMLYPDLFQRFLPKAIPYWDRGWTLEATWEQAWHEITGTHRFERDFYELWDDDKEDYVPGLILNSTSAEEGNRVLISNLKIQDDATTDCLEAFWTMTSSTFKDVYDHDHQLNLRRCNKGEPPRHRTVALSTAINGSARFSFVSPAGKVNRNLHIVDGGYFENSGATTAEEVVLAIRNHPLYNAHLRPIILHISNEPELTSVVGILGAPFNVTIGNEVKQCVRLEIHKQTAGQIGKSALCEEPRSDKKATIIVALQADESTYATLTKLKQQQGAQETYVAAQLDMNGKIIGLAKPEPWVLAEVLTPLKTVIQTREGRGVYAVKHLRALVQPSEGDDLLFFHFGLRQGSIELPLGWALSEYATKDIDEQLERAFACPHEEDQESLYVYLQTLRKCWQGKSVS